MRVLPDKPEDISLASHVRLVLIRELFASYEQTRAGILPQMRWDQALEIHNYV